MALRVLHVASEVAPFAQSGGLADVLAGLTRALAEMRGLHVAVLVPLYRGVEAKLAAAGIALDAGTAVTVSLGAHVFPAALRRTRVTGVELCFLDCAVLYDRPGGLYGPSGASEFADNHLRFGALGKIAAEYGAKLLGGSIDILHVHDWQGALAAIYTRLVGGRRPAIVTTVHNLAYRGIFPKQIIDELELPWSLFDIHQLEFYDQVALLKGAMAVADVVTTVSPTYAHEILTPAFGEALDGFLTWDVKRLVGIVNGIDAGVWDPGTDAAIAAPYTASAQAGKARCRAALANEVGLVVDDRTPLLGVIARMTGQKGLDLVADAVPELHRLGAKLVVLGSGEPDLEARFTYVAGAFADDVAVRIGFDIAFSRRVYAGSDLFVMPSRFEPCGLGQLYAMRYGSIPIVHAVGGLRDTVTDIEEHADGTGIRFEPATVDGLVGAIERAVALFRDPHRLAAVRTAAMKRDSSWTASAHQYAQLYRSL
jgi:starch synthase